jgi:hypothetical protein
VVLLLLQFLHVVPQCREQDLLKCAPLDLLPDVDLLLADLDLVLMFLQLRHLMHPKPLLWMMRRQWIRMIQARLRLTNPLLNLGKLREAEQDYWAVSKGSEKANSKRLSQAIVVHLFLMRVVTQVPVMVLAVGVSSLEVFLSCLHEEDRLEVH